MVLTPGSRLGTYHILSSLGVGGMGEVYRAHDTKLDRDVALKILPASMAGDHDRLMRFEREARTLAALNHPNIAAIYGLEEPPGQPTLRALVMEHIEGDDLSVRLAGGALPVVEALVVAQQIADALGAAHEAGIIHRDLKPSNIKVRDDGVVKVLDFGLAKAAEPRSGTGDGASSPTMTPPAVTATGMILGTAAYMAPEQARGRTVDRRADVWAFGVVLFEMLSGRRMFAGSDTSEVIASVLRDTPDFALLPPSTPAEVRRLLQRCLQKDPSARLDSMRSAGMDIADARAALADAAKRPYPLPSDGGLARSSGGGRPWGRALPWALFAATAVAAVATRSVPNTATAPPVVTRSLVDFPQSALSSGRLGNLLTLSSDGMRLVYLGNPEGRNRLYLRRLDQFDASAIPGTENGSQPFFSPDGQWVGLFAAGKLKKVSLAGGPAITVADALSPEGGAWGPDDTIVFAPDARGLMRVSAAGGEAQRLTERAGDSALRQAWPTILPDGKTALFTSVTSAVTAAIDAVSIDTGQVSRIVESGCCASYSMSGHLIYAHPTSGAVFAVPFDPARLAVTGKPVQVLEGAMVGLTVGSHYAVSKAGSLVYLANNAISARAFVWVDRTGRSTPVDLEQRTYGPMTMSPDGRRLTTHIYEGVNPKEIWTGDLQRGTLSRIASDGAINSSPIWTPDGRRITFSSTRDQPRQNLYWAAADGSGTAERLTTSDFSQVTQDWSPDGTTLVFYERRPATGIDLWALTLDAARTTRPLLATPADEHAARFSPDGRYLAYSSDRSGRLEVYAQPFPGPGEVRQLSTDGGTEPVWARHGRELFFRQGERMMVVDVSTAPTFSASRPRVLFVGRFEMGFLVPGARYYDVSADSQRFLMLRSEDLAAPRQLRLVVNWFEELKRLVPRPGN